MECIARTPHDTPRRDSRQARANTQSHPLATSQVATSQAVTSLQRGYVLLDAALLRSLRQTRMFSQQDLADDCWRRNIQLSLTTIKRAEAGRAVRFRIARAFAHCFDLPVERIAQITPQAVAIDA